MAAIAAGAIGLLCFSSSVAFALNGGEEEKPLAGVDAGTDGSGADAGADAGADTGSGADAGADAGTETTYQGSQDDMRETSPHVKAQYVDVENTLEEGPQNIAEIEVYDTLGVNVAPNGTASMSSKFNNDFPAAYVNDGSISTFAHTKANHYEHAYIRVNLGKVVNVTKIVIKNRQDCCKDRLDGTWIRMFDSNMSRIKGSPTLTGSKNQYTWDVVANTLS